MREKAGVSYSIFFLVEIYDLTKKKRSIPSRKKVQKNKKRKIQVVVMTKKELLLLKTKEERGSFWQNITGGVKKEETFKEGALRELYEESGIFEGKIKYIGLIFEFKDKRSREVKEKSYLCLLDEKPPKIQIDSHEHQSYQWIEHQEVDESKFGHYTNFLAYLGAKSLL